MNTNVRELMLAGAHFGHRVRFSNPKMGPFIYGKYRSTHIINLDQTLEAMMRAAEYLKSVAESNGKILYVCTKPAASDAIAEEAKSVGMPYVNRRWLGGILTNFKTTRNSVERLETIEAQIAEGALKNMTKKEGIKLMLMKDKLERAIGGIREMNELPDALFIVDAGWHKGAAREANKLGIPVVAVVDTNHSPDNIDYVIPGNDDSREAITIYIREMTAAICSGSAAWEKNLVSEIKANNPIISDADKAGETKAKSKVVTQVTASKKGEKDVNVTVVEKSTKPAQRHLVAKPAENISSEEEK